MKKHYDPAHKGPGHKKGPKAPEVFEPHPPHMKDGKTQPGYKGKAIEPKKGANGHGHMEHKGTKRVAKK